MTTKIHAIVDALGNPVALSLTPCQAADITQAVPLLDQVAPDAFLADKRYHSDALVETLQKRGITPVIPPKANRREPRKTDFALYRERNLVERFFCKLKQYRAIATRDHKLANTFLAAVAIVCILFSLNSLQALGLFAARELYAGYLPKRLLSGLKKPAFAGGGGAKSDLFPMISSATMRSFLVERFEMHAVNPNTSHPPDAVRQDLIYERLLRPFPAPAKPRLRFSSTSFSAHLQNFAAEIGLYPRKAISKREMRDV